MFGPPVRGRAGSVLLVLEVAWLLGTAGTAIAGYDALPLLLLGGAVVASCWAWAQRTRLRRGWPLVASDEARVPVSRRSFWRLHAWVLAVALLLLDAFSLPALGFVSLFLAVPLLGVVGVWWLVLLVRTLRHGGPRWPHLVAPALGLLVVALIAADAPLEARWAVSRHAFAAQAERVMAAPDSQDVVEVPEWIGLYHVLGAERVPQGVIFEEANGGLVDDSGFVWLPHGPDPSMENGSFERPEFRHLSGPWYAWTASW